MILSATILLLILLPILGSLILSLPDVQNKLVERASLFATEYLGTEVSVGRINVTMRGGVEVCDLLTRDLQGDTLLYISRVESKIESFLPGRRLGVGNSLIEGATLNLMARTIEGEDGEAEIEMNIKQISRMLSNPDNPSPMEIFVNNVVVKNLHLRIEQLTPLNPEYGVDMRSLEMRNLSGSVSSLTISGPALHGYVERLSTIEKSGFEVRDLTGEIYITEGALALTDMTLDSRWSSLKIPHLMLAGRAWSEYREFNRAAVIDVKIAGGTLSTDDLGYFAPAVRDWGVQIRDIEILAEGEVENLNLTIDNITYGNDTHLATKISVEGLPLLERTRYRVDLQGLTTNAIDLDHMKWSITGRGFTEELVIGGDAMGQMTLRGELSGEANSFVGEASVDSDAGEVWSNFEISTDKHKAISLAGELQITDAKMGQLVPSSGLGMLSMGLTVVDGVVDGKRSRGVVNADVAMVEWDKYRVEGVNLSTSFRDGSLPKIEIKSRDKSVKLDISGRANNIFGWGGVPDYDVALDIEELNLKALNINRRDSISQLRAKLSLKGEGLDLEECWGDFDISSGHYIYNNDTLTLAEPVTLAVRSSHRRREIDLNSEFATAQFRSKSSVARIANYIAGFVAHYIPALYSDPERYITTDGGAGDVDSLDMSQLSVETRMISPLFAALNSGLEVGEGASFEASFNPAVNHLEAKLTCPLFEHGTTIAMGIEGEINNEGDSITLTSRAREILVGTSLIESAQLNATAIDNRVEMRSQFINPADSASANVGGIVRVMRSDNGDRSFDLRMLPSRITRRNNEWDLESRAITINKQGVDIDQFRIESGDQLMSINGRASSSLRDTVVMDMNNFDLSIFSTLISQLGYRIEGRTNGRAYIASALTEARLDANIDLDSVSVNTLASPPMSLSAQWDSSRNQARLLLTDRISRDTMLRGFYVPSEVRYYATLSVDSLQMAMLDPPLGGVITSTTGTADLRLTLEGRRREAHLNGTITANNVATTVDYTNVRYHIPRAVFEVNDNMLNCSSAYVDDGQEDGGGGNMAIEVNLQHLSNIGYKIRLTPREMLVLNTTERDNDLFYGRIFASGAASITGDKSGVKMDIAARTASSSHFYMPLQSKSNVSTADFITFVQPTKRDTSEHLHLRRLLANERENRTKATGAMEINMSLDVQPNTELQLVIDPTVGDIIKATGEGKLNLRIEPKSNIFDIYGDYTINEGSYLFTLRNIVNKRFVIDPGSSIQWSGPPADPLLSINAIYKLKASLEPLISDESTRAVPVDCVINLSDRLTSPEVSFAIELPSSDAEQQAAVANQLNDQESISRQFFYLMLANSFIPESSSGGTSDLGVSTTAATGFELLTNQLSNWLSSSNYNVVIRYRPESELAGDEVDFGFSKGLINNRLLLEVEGNYIIDNKQAISDDASNFMGEAYITWLIDRAGALRLKGFTQTIDTYDENQGLQETGIGVYYRENFDNFKDLRERVKARFSSERRNKRREARRKEEEVN